GREWYGESFGSTTVHNFEFDLKGAVPDEKMQITSAVLGQSYGNTSMEVLVNNEKAGEITLPPIPEGRYFTKGNEEKGIFNYSVKSNSDPVFKISLKYNSANGVKST